MLQVIFMYLEALAIIPGLQSGGMHGVTLLEYSM